MSDWTTKTVALSDIDLDASPQMRTNGLDAEHVAALVDADEKDIPRVVLVRIETARYLVVDGWHRIAARKSAGKRTIEATWRPGDAALAEWLACAANRKHGVKRTREDARRAVAAALANEHGAKLGDQALAKHVGVHRSTVAEVRAQLDKPTSSPKRVGVDGKARDTSKIAEANRKRAKPSKVLPRRTAAELAAMDELRKNTLVENPVRRLLDEDAAEREAVAAEGAAPVGKGGSLPIRAEAARMAAAAGGEAREMPTHVTTATRPLESKDARGTALPAGVVKSWADGKEVALGIANGIESALRGVSLAKGWLTRGTVDLGERGREDIVALGEHLRVAAVMAADLTPYAVCPRCGGTKCIACRGRGWVSQHVLQQLETKAAE